MTTLPEEVFVRREDVLGCGLGISAYALRRAVEIGLVDRRVFPGMKYGRYRRADIRRVFGTGGTNSEGGTRNGEHEKGERDV